GACRQRGDRDSHGRLDHHKSRPLLHVVRAADVVVGGGAGHHHLRSGRHGGHGCTDGRGNNRVAGWRCYIINPLCVIVCRTSHDDYGFGGRNRSDYGSDHHGGADTGPESAVVMIHVHVHGSVTMDVHVDVAVHVNIGIAIDVNIRISVDVYVRVAVGIHVRLAAPRAAVPIRRAQAVGAHGRSGERNAGESNHADSHCSILEKTLHGLSCGAGFGSYFFAGSFGASEAAADPAAAPSSGSKSSFLGLTTILS